MLADPVHDLMRWAKGTRAAHDGDTAAALHHLAASGCPCLGRLAAVDRIDAAVRAGDRERPPVGEELAPFAEGTRWPWALAAVDHGRALLAEPADAPPCSRAPWPTTRRCRARPCDEARTQLAYGEFLRRAQRRVDARAHLRRALETFEDLRAEPLAARAAQELRASGETARKRDPSTLLKLTPMERQVAQLVQPGHVQQGHRRPVLGLAPHRRLPPAEHLHEGRRHLPRRAGPARPDVTARVGARQERTRARRDPRAAVMRATAAAAVNAAVKPVAPKAQPPRHRMR